MKLKKMMYLNIDALHERKQWMEEGFDNIGVPSAMRERFQGIDGNDYETYDALLAALPDFMSKTRGTWLEGRRGTTALHYGHYLMYQAVTTANADECVLILHDDCRPSRPFKEYVQLAADLPDFDMVQLMRWDYALHGNMNEPEIRRRAALVPTLPPKRPCPERPDFAYGTHGPGDQAILCSPAGAQKICALIEDNPAQSIEQTFVDVSFEWNFLSPIEHPSSHWQNPQVWTHVMQHQNFSHPRSYREFVDGEST